MFLVERRISLFLIVHGQTRMSTSLQSLPGLGSGSPRSLTIGSDGWLLTIIVLRSSFLVGLFTDKGPPGNLRLQMNFLRLLSLGLEIQIHGSERRGRRAKDCRLCRDRHRRHYPEFRTIPSNRLPSFVSKESG